jgi:hypothetical protein
MSNPKANVNQQRGHEDKSLEMLLKYLGIAVTLAAIVIVFPIVSNLNWVILLESMQQLPSLNDLQILGSEIYHTIENQLGQFIGLV